KNEVDCVEQRENLFHSRVEVQGNVVSLIVDNGSVVDAASHLLVHKLNLPTTKHPKPYSLHWFNDDGEVKVKEQVLVAFKWGGYEDERLFDIVPMDASYLLLGRPWQFDRKVIHDGYTNKVHLTHKG
ncbi:retropepsin-like aspartic protease, partial [Cronobacter sakazakii]|uniref:retropepsin-like aspartic protease n=1 Tax=Cronobacter sakazakii TaxID=28141 RepID=UPI003F7909AD